VTAMNLPKLLFASALIAILLALGVSTRGQNAPRAADSELELLDQKVKDFLQSTIDDDIDTAFQDFLAGGPLARQTEALANLKLKTKELQMKYGPFRNVEQISAKRVGRDLVLMKYLYSCESFPVVWYASFYRNYKRGEVPRENAWSVVTLRFDTDLDLLALGE
jgi:hypothetical protein